MVSGDTPPKLTPESRPTPTMITRSRAAAQSLSPELGKRTASSRATDKRSRFCEASAKRKKDARGQGGAAAASAFAATDEGSYAASKDVSPAAAAGEASSNTSSSAKRKKTMGARQEDAAAASAAIDQASYTASQEDVAVAVSPAAAAAAAGEASSTTSSPVRCPMIPEVIKFQDQRRVVYEPFDSALVDAFMEEDKKYTAKLESQQTLLTLNENWATTCLDHEVMLPVRESATDTVLEAAESVLGLSSYTDGKLLARSSGFLIDWDKTKQCGTILTSANLLCTKPAPVDLWSCPRDYDPNIEVLVHLLDETVVKGKLLNYHGHYNIALFELIMNVSTEIPVWSESVDYGQEVFLVGRDEKLHLNSNHGRVKCTDPGLYDHHHYMYVDCEVSKYGVGGLAIDNNGRVMGMVNPTPRAAFIPTTIILRCLRMWRDFKCVPRLHLGLKLSSIKFLRSTHREKLRCMFKIRSGVIVQEVSEGSPAEKVGIRNGDVIRSLNGECFSTTVELELMLMRICEDCLDKGSGLGSNVDLAVDLFQIRKERNCTKKLTLSVSEAIEVIAEGTYFVSARAKNCVNMSSGQETSQHKGQ